MNVPSAPPPLPPPVPNAAGGGSFRALAIYSWVSVFVSIVIDLAMAGAAQPTQTREETLGKAIIAGFLAVTGVLAGIIALFAIPKYGRKGLLWPALSGICVWLLLAALAIPTFNAARRKALQTRDGKAKLSQLTPLVHIPDAVRVSDAMLGFSFELPSGYVAFPADKKLPGYQYAYFKQNSGKAASVAALQILPGTISPYARLTPKSLPAGMLGSLTNFAWRGLEVDGFRVPETVPGGSYVTFKAQIPLRQKAIQLAFGGPADDEAEVRALAERVLSTLDGPVNW